MRAAGMFPETASQGLSGLVLTLASNSHRPRSGLDALTLPLASTQCPSLLQSRGTWSLPIATGSDGPSARTTSVVPDVPTPLGEKNARRESSGDHACHT